MQPTQTQHADDLVGIGCADPVKYETKGATDDNSQCDRIHDQSSFLNNNIATGIPAANAPAANR